LDGAGADGRIILKQMLQDSSGRVLTWFIWYGIRTICRLLWTGQLILNFKKAKKVLNDAETVSCSRKTLHR